MATHDTSGAQAMEMTLDQQKAIAMASARMRAAEAESTPEQAAPEAPQSRWDSGIQLYKDAGRAALDIGATLGQGVGNTALGVQKLVGKGANAIGAENVGNWLVNDANKGKANLAREAAPSHARQPVAGGVSKFVGEVLPTFPVGGALAKGASKIPALTKALPGLAPALRTGGFSTGLATAPLLSRAGAVNMGTRMLGGGGAAIGAQTMIDGGFENTGMAAGLGAALPAGFKVAGEAGMLVADKAIKPAAQRLMQSALKPTIKQLKTGDARVAVDTLLDYGINPNQRGVEKLRGVVDDLNADISGRIANSKATVNKQAVSSYLDDVRSKFGNQVSPTSDLNAISAIGDDFMSQPSLPGNNIPVQLAQKLKTGTYKALSGKYGETGSAATEAQKALARGLKDEIGFSVPGISQLNAEEARLLKTLGVAERRALMELNKNPVGLAALAGNPVGFMAFMADRSAAFKSLGARMINQAAKAPKYIEPTGNKLLSNPAARGGLLTIQADQ